MVLNVTQTLLIMTFALVSLKAIDRPYSVTGNKYEMCVLYVRKRSDLFGSTYITTTKKNQGMSYNIMRLTTGTPFQITCHKAVAKMEVDMTVFVLTVLFVGIQLFI